jgi:hypothetical protein
MKRVENLPNIYKDMMNFFNNAEMTYVEGSGVGVLDLFLISSMINESILQSIFAGFILIVPVVWLLYLRNSLWKAVITEHVEDLLSQFSGKDVLGEIQIEENLFHPKCLIRTIYGERELVIKCSAHFGRERFEVHFEGVDTFLTDMTLENLKEIIAQQQTIIQDDETA